MLGFVKLPISIAKLQQVTGLTPILTPQIMNKSKLFSDGYREQEVKDMAAFVGFSANDNVLAQLKNSTEFIDVVDMQPCLVSVPYYKVISKQTMAYSVN